MRKEKGRRGDSPGVMYAQGGISQWKEQELCWVRGNESSRQPGSAQTKMMSKCGVTTVSSC